MRLRKIVLTRRTWVGDIVRCLKMNANHRRIGGGHECERFLGARVVGLAGCLIEAEALDRLEFKGRLKAENCTARGTAWLARPSPKPLVFPPLSAARCSRRMRSVRVEKEKAAFTAFRE